MGTFRRWHAVSTFLQTGWLKTLNGPFVPFDFRKVPDTHYILLPFPSL